MINAAIAGVVGSGDGLQERGLAMKGRGGNTENPDGSGTARWTRPQDNGGEELLSFSWNSVRKAPFTMSYSHCKEDNLGERVCGDGGF